MKRLRLVRGKDYEFVSLPREFWEFGRRMTEHMIGFQTTQLTLADLVANAYLQGLEHGYRAAEHKAVQTPDTAR